MKAWILLALLTVTATMAFAQRHNIGTINAETPEGQLLQQIGQEADEAKKAALLEQFAAQHAQHEGIGWVYSQMLSLYLKLNQPDKALAAGEKLLKLDPEDAQTAHNCLKAAESKKDAELIRTWAVRTSDVARKAAAAPKPADEDDAEEWKHNVDFAKQLDIYAEYALYNAALQAADPAKKVELIETLEQRNPNSQYLPQISVQRFLALRQAGQNDKAVTLGEKLFEKNEANEDMLLVMADHYFQAKKEPEKVIKYSAKMVEIMTAKAKPEGISAEDWEKKKKLTLGLGHWWPGITYSTQNKFSQADQLLRGALPFISDNNELLAPALFHLGLANFKLGDAGKGDTKRILESVKFNQQCAAIKSPFQAQANANLKAIRSRYSIK